MSALIMVPSRASISISVRGLFLTAFKMSACQTGMKRRFRRGSDSIPAEICASRACMERPIRRSTVDIATSSPISYVKSIGLRPKQGWQEE